MAGCLYYKKSFSPKSENYLSKHEQMQFLILLQEDDYKSNILSCFQSNKDTLFRNKNKFPGKLTIYNYDNIDDSEFRQKYVIEGNILPKLLYVKLLKENIFIPFESYPMRYLNSKLSELRDLFIALRAKTIKISKTQEKKNDTKIECKLNAKVSNIEVGVGAGLENMQKLTDNTSSELHFLDTGKPIRMDELHNCKSFYYLPKEYEWADIIERRINNNLVSDKYTYEHSEFKLLKTNILSKLQMLDISVNYNDEEYTNIRIHYEIEYYPLQMDDTSSKLQTIKEPTHRFHFKDIVERIQSSFHSDSIPRVKSNVSVDVPTIQTSNDSTYTICSSYMDSISNTNNTGLVIEIESPRTKTPVEPVHNPIVEETVPVPIVEEPIPVPVIEEPVPSTIIEESVPAPVIEEPVNVSVTEESVPAPIVEEPVPAPVIEEPVTVPIVEEPVPTPVVEETVSAPIVEEPVPAPIVEEPVPAPIVEEPVPAPIIEETISVPVPIVEEPVLAPIIEETISVPVPIVEEPVLVPIVEEPVPVPVVEEPVPTQIIIEEPVFVIEDPVEETIPSVEQVVENVLEDAVHTIIETITDAVIPERVQDILETVIETISGTTVSEPNV